ncbi:hypothetical protein E2P81_ATG02107 [Venturia nashicola]|uniref:Uncharacterized protein n=1 Tax=Venturia nashicola TaxID=86259 RepID=A0A4Z1PLP7_9PEZI|nr:hypothetical protein E6O75_ATG02158 [Venturia nashicola]TLD35804.1 hypothetical protein E2P81_ATG02107 [Venturia nashicola]
MHPPTHIMKWSVRCALIRLAPVLEQGFFAEMRQGGRVDGVFSAGAAQRSQMRMPSSSAGMGLHRSSVPSASSPSPPAPTTSPLHQQEQDSATGTTHRAASQPTTRACLQAVCKQEWNAFRTLTLRAPSGSKEAGLHRLLSWQICTLSIRSFAPSHLQS